MHFKGHILLYLIRKKVAIILYIIYILYIYTYIQSYTLVCYSFKLKFYPTRLLVHLCISKSIYSLKSISRITQTAIVQERTILQILNIFYYKLWIQRLMKLLMRRKIVVNIYNFTWTEERRSMLSYACISQTKTSSKTDIMAIYP